MRPIPEAASSSAPGGNKRRLSGPRVVLAVGVAAVVVAGLVMLLGFFVAADRGDPVAACQKEPAVCATVRDFVTAQNERDLEGMLELLTEDGLVNFLGIASAEELEQRLQSLTPADHIESVEINRVSLDGDRAMVVARLKQRDDEFPAVYRLIRDDGDWFIDG